jgi:selenocysteine lyase/cysteine desulfurase
VSRKIDGSARASFYLYNNEKEIAKFAETLRKISEMFA